MLDRGYHDSVLACVLCRVPGHLFMIAAVLSRELYDTTWFTVKVTQLPRMNLSFLSEISFREDSQPTSQPTPYRSLRVQGKLMKVTLIVVVINLLSVLSVSIDSPT